MALKTTEVKKKKKEHFQRLILTPNLKPLISNTLFVFNTVFSSHTKLLATLAKFSVAALSVKLELILTFDEQSELLLFFFFGNYLNE